MDHLVYLLLCLFFTLCYTAGYDDDLYALYSENELLTYNGKRHIWSKNLLYELQDYYNSPKQGKKTPNIPLEKPKWKRFDLLGPVLGCPKLKSYGRGDSEKRFCGDLNKTKDCVVLSIGSACAWDFEQAIYAQTSCRVETFDCTVNCKVPVGIEDRVHFHHRCMGSREQSRASNHFYDYEAILGYLGMKKPPTFLKMDIEGYEYEVMRSIMELDDQDMYPEQIAMEIHYKTQVSNGLGWSYRYLTAGELAVFSETLWEYGDYALLDRHDNTRCPHCTEVLLGRI